MARLLSGGWTGGAALSGLFAVILLGAGCHRQHAAAPAAVEQLPSVRVRVQTVESGKRVASEEVVGTVRAKLRAVIAAKINGRIEQMLVTSGQSVKEGDPLVRLDLREIQAKLDQAKAVREQAQNDLQRFSALLKQEAVTRAEFDAVQARARVAVAAVTEAETLLGYADITAPFTGLITRKLADIGDLATAGRPLLEMEDPASLRFEAEVPEAILDRVSQGMKLTVHLASLAGLALPGKVGEIAPTADPNSRTSLVKIDLPPTQGLRAGQFGRVAIPVSETEALRAPVSAVVRRGQMEMVFVVANQRVQLRLVKTGKTMGNEVELVSGVNPGESLVVEGAASLVDGQPVEAQ